MQIAKHIVLLNLADVKPDPNQPRKDKDAEDTIRLGESIAERGQLQPIVVRKSPDGKYIIKAGERRWLAHITHAKLLAKGTIEAVIEDDKSELDTLLDQVMENTARKMMNPIETVAAYQRALDLGGEPAQISKAIGISDQTLKADLPLLILPDDIKKAIDKREISKDIGRQIAALPPEMWKSAFKRALSAGNGKQAAAKIAALSNIGQSADAILNIKPQVSQSELKAAGDALDKLTGGVRAVSTKYMNDLGLLIKSRSKNIDRIEQACKDMQAIGKQLADAVAKYKAHTGVR